jgi:hypothetical protein
VIAESWRVLGAAYKDDGDEGDLERAARWSMLGEPFS